MDFDEFMTKELGFKENKYGNDSIEPGWYDLVAKLVRDLDELGWDRDLIQIKQKFGSLRYYVGQTTPQMQDLITWAEEASAKICELCGKSSTPKRYDRGGWMMSLCDSCR